MEGRSLFAWCWVFIVGSLILTVAGRALSDAGNKRLDVEQKAVVLDLNRPYWAYLPLALDLVFLGVVFWNRQFVRSFYAVLFAEVIYLVVIVVVRRRTLLKKGLPADFVTVRTVSMVLQQLSGPSMLTAIYLLPGSS